jgi:uncharacterized protein
MGQFLRILIILAVLWLAVGLIKAYLGRRRTPRRPRTVPTPMRRCAHCGVHVPANEGYVAGGRFYCTREHAGR